jgi:hypothetical protein
MTGSLASFTKTAAWLGGAVLLLAALALGYQAGQWTAPEPANRTRTDTVEVERTLVERDTVTETVPRTVVRYDTVTQVDTLVTQVPTDMRVQGVIPPSPVDIGEEVRLTYYDPQAQRWTQNRYNIPKDSWHLWPSIRAASTPTGLQATAAANLRWRRVTVSAGYMQAASRRGVTFGVELRPFTISW